MCEKKFEIATRTFKNKFNTESLIKQTIFANFSVFQNYFTQYILARPAANGSENGSAKMKSSKKYKKPADF